MNRWQTTRCDCGALLYPQIHSCGRCYDTGGLEYHHCFCCGHTEFGTVGADRCLTRIDRLLPMVVATPSIITDEMAEKIKREWAAASNARPIMEYYAPWLPTAEQVAHAVANSTITVTGTDPTVDEDEVDELRDWVLSHDFHRPDE